MLICGFHRENSYFILKRRADNLRNTAFPPKAWNLFASCFHSVRNPYINFLKVYFWKFRISFELIFRVGPYYVLKLSSHCIPFKKASSSAWNSVTSFIKNSNFGWRHFTYNLILNLSICFCREYLLYIVVRENLGILIRNLFLSRNFYHICVYNGYLLRSWYTRLSTQFSSESNAFLIESML